MHQPSRRFLLRERTAAAHRRVDERVGSFDTVEAYGHYLTGLYRFRLPIERALRGASFPHSLESWQPTLVGPELSADLLALGLPVHDVPEWPVGLLADDSSLFGCLYVLEGSGFGARILLKRALALGLDRGHGASHLSRQASSDSWTVFVSALENADGLDMERVVSAALSTFAAAEKAFTRLEDVE
ncbi:MAG: biliverdin-producing heme oxygenase [Mesorhizobium sp.]|uniref:biliverdin-producing heme oxygenase n=1 Tax=Mesorhizobium sp. TaxID=1871066 RepID=UPI001AC25DEC|nr:biliverdin-producing heme oxygenase [Mesorhizobium sp.]MBN9218122.1 biliverdin-producing heme oxygenase [Mesorhizobium sp.]